MPVVVAPGLALLALIQPEMEVTWNQGGVYYAGRIRAISPRDEWRADYIELDIECQDYTSLLNDEICTSARSVVETDAQRISWLLQSFDRRGISARNVQTLYANMPAQDFTGMTLNDAIKAVLAFSNGGFYVDYSKDLHTFVAESLTAPFALSDNPDNVTSFGYNSFQYPQDSVDLRNAVYGIPAVNATVLRPDSASVTITTASAGGLDATGPIILASFKALPGLRIAQVGALGPFVTGTAASVSPTFAQATQAGHLLIALVGPGGTIPTTTQAGWVQAVGFLSLDGEGLAIWYKPGSAAGETAPTFTSSGGAGPLNAQLVEFSGASYLAPEQTVTADIFANPQVATASSIDANVGNLIVVASGWDLHTAASSTFNETFSNGAPSVHVGDSGGSVQRFPVSFAYGIIPISAQPAWYTDEISIATYGRREAAFTSSTTTTQSALDALGAAYITAHSNPLKHSSLRLPPGSPVGLTAGQTINVTNSLYGLTAQPFRIQSVDTTYPTDDKPQFSVQFADPVVTVTTQMAGLQTQIAAVNSATQGTAATVAANTLGTLGYAQIIASQTGITTAVDVAGLVVTVSVGSGRRIRISVAGLLLSTVNTDGGQVTIMEGASQLAIGIYPMATQIAADLSVILTPTAGSHTYKVQAARNSGTGSLTFNAGATLPAYLMVEDIGV